jgi:hypothetical protein
MAAAARGLAAEEHALASETREQAAKLTAAEVFGLALAQASRNMARAAQELDRGQPGPAAQRAEQDAVAALARLLEALAPSKPKPDGEEPNAGDGQQTGQGKRSAASIAELKLLKLMQQDLNARYQRLREAERTPQSAAEMTELAIEQGRLAEMTLKLSEPSEADVSEENEEQSDEPADAPPSDDLRRPNKDTI